MYRLPAPPCACFIPVDYFSERVAARVQMDLCSRTDLPFSDADGSSYMTIPLIEPLSLETSREAKQMLGRVAVHVQHLTLTDVQACVAPAVYCLPGCATEPVLSFTRRRKVIGFTLPVSVCDQCGNCRPPRRHHLPRLRAALCSPLAARSLATHPRCEGVLSVWRTSSPAAMPRRLLPSSRRSPAEATGRRRQVRIVAVVAVGMGLLVNAALAVSRLVT